jgi:hypothetical protein
MGTGIRATLRQPAAQILVPGLLTACAAAAVVACARDVEESAPESTEGQEAAHSGAKLGLLAELGYVDFAEGGDPSRSGVVEIDEARSAPGYNLVTSLPDSTTLLLGPGGEEVHRWVLEGTTHTPRSELLSNGDVLILAHSEAAGDEAGSFLTRLAWDGTTIWRLDIDAHHDVRITPKGDILTLTSRFAHLPGFGARCRDDLLKLLSPNGKRITQCSLFELLSSESGFFKRAGQQIARREWGTPWIEVFHANSAHWLPYPELIGTSPLYRADSVLVSLRSQNTIAIVDVRRRESLWMWGWEELEGQHDATFLPNGNILLFDNGNVERMHSRVLEVDPRTEQIVWEWRAPHPPDFYSEGRGTVQPLANGNVLVGNSNSGEAFEVTRDGDVVWRYLNPFVGERGRSVLRIRRYDLEYVASFSDRLER